MRRGKSSWTERLLVLCKRSGELLPPKNHAILAHTHGNTFFLSHHGYSWSLYYRLSFSLSSFSYCSIIPLIITVPHFRTLSSAIIIRTTSISQLFSYQPTSRIRLQFAQNYPISHSRYIVASLLSLSYLYTT